MDALTLRAIHKRFGDGDLEGYPTENMFKYLSSMIVSGQMSRNQAPDALSEPPYAPGELRRDRAYACTKLRITGGRIRESTQAAFSTSHRVCELGATYNRLMASRTLLLRARGLRVTIYG